MRQPRNVISLGLVSSFTDFSSSMVVPLLPLYVVMILDEGVDKVGFILAITTLVSYLLRFFGGILSDKFDQNKPFLIIGYGLSSIAKPLLSLSGNWWSVATIRSTDRLGKAVRAAPKDKLISLSANSGKEGSSYSVHKTIEKIGEIGGLALLLGLLIMLGTGESAFRTIFAASALPGLLGLMILIFFVKDIRGASTKKQQFNLALEPRLQRTVIAFAAVSFCMFNESFFILLGKAQGLGLPQIISLLIAMRSVQVLTSYQVGKYLDRFPIKSILTMGYALGIVSMLLLFSQGFIFLAVAFLIFGAHEVVMINAVRTFISKNAEDKGSAFGSFYFIVAIAAAGGAYTLGLVWEYLGVFYAISLASIGILFASIIHISSCSNLEANS